VRATQPSVALATPRAERSIDTAAEAVVFDAPEWPVARMARLHGRTGIMTKRSASRLAAFAAATLIGLTGAAFAKPFHHGHGGGGDVVMSIMRLKSQLNLNTSQQAMWDNAVAAGKAARTTARTNMQKVHDTLAAELAKAEPDLAAVSAASDSARNANAALHAQVRDAWLNLYSTFTPEQKTVVKNALSQRMAKMEQFHQKMLQRHSNGG
jgi:Spy/CpxP family protein refolding chaperone